MQIRTINSHEYHLVAEALALAYAKVASRMTEADASAFLTELPAAVLRFAAQGRWLIAEERQRFVGAVAYFAPHSTGHRLFQGNVAHVQLLGVIPQSAKVGVGIALIEECLRMARESGASELLLQTSELMIEARNFYQRLGFCQREELPPVWGAPTFLYAKNAA